MRPKFFGGLALSLLGGCGLWGEVILCPSVETIVSQTPDDTLSCGDLRGARTYFEFLAARRLTANQKGRLYASIRDRHQSDPQDMRTLLTALATSFEQARTKIGLERAEFRSHELWLIRSGQGPFSSKDTVAWDVFTSAVSIWARSDSQELVLTEMDIEGWVKLGSLCREVQGGSPLRVSIANREQVYGSMSREFEGLERSDQIGRVSVGMFWPQIEEAWQVASYEKQQSWVRVAPLPPAMNATSRAYLEAVLELPPHRTAATLHQVIGPFSSN